MVASAYEYVSSKGVVIPLSKEELSSFKWRHPLFALDDTFNTEIEGQATYDDTLNGWVFWSMGVWYWTERTNKPPDVSFLATILKPVGTGIGAGIKPVADAASPILWPLVIIGIVILLFQSGVLKGIRK